MRQCNYQSYLFPPTSSHRHQLKLSSAHAGSYNASTMPLTERISPSDRKRRSTLRLTGSHGVKWSPASWLLTSLNRRMSSSKHASQYILQADSTVEQALQQSIYFFLLVILGLCVPKVVILATCIPQQLVMAAPLHHAALVEHSDIVAEPA